MTPPGQRQTEYPRPSVTVDVVVFTVADDDLKVLLVRRGQPPHAGAWALPGGFVRVSDEPGSRGEGLEDAAYRELREEAGLGRGKVFLEQLYTFGDPDRDPRGRVISVAYYALMRPEFAAVVEAGTDAADVSWFSVSELPALAFDHARILEVAVERIRGKVDYTPIAFNLVSPAFTVREIRSVYSAIKGRDYNAGTFLRRFRRWLEDGMIRPAPGKRSTATRPAKVYRLARP